MHHLYFLPPHRPSIKYQQGFWAVEKKKSMAQNPPLNTSDFQIHFKCRSFEKISLMIWAQCESTHE